MDEITLNGFEVFEDFLPGANVPKKETQPAGNDDTNEDILDGVGESMTDEELEALRNPKKKDDKKDDVDEVVEDDIPEDVTEEVSVEPIEEITQVVDDVPAVVENTVVDVDEPVVEVDED